MNGADETMILEEHPAVIVRLNDGRPTEVLLSIRMEPRPAAELVQLCDRLQASKGESRVRPDPREFRLRTVEIPSLSAADAARWRKRLETREMWVLCSQQDDPTRGPGGRHRVRSLLVGYDGLEILIEGVGGDVVGVAIVPPLFLAALSVLGSVDANAFVERLLALDQRNPGLAAGCLGASHEAIIGRPEVSKALPSSAISRLLTEGSDFLREFLVTHLREQRGSEA